MSKSIKLKNNTYWDSTNIVYGHEQLKTTIDNLKAKDTSQDTSINSALSRIKALEGLPNFQYAILYDRENRKYSANAWSRPKFKFSGLLTNDTSVFERSGTEYLKIKKSGTYLIILERETNLNPGVEQDCFMSVGGNYTRFDIYSNSATLFFSANANAGDLICADINTGQTSFYTRHVEILVIKLS